MEEIQKSLAADEASDLPRWSSDVPPPAEEGQEQEQKAVEVQRYFASSLINYGGCMPHPVEVVIAEGHDRVVAGLEAERDAFATRVVELETELRDAAELHREIEEDLGRRAARLESSLDEATKQLEAAKSRTLPAPRIDVGAIARLVSERLAAWRQAPHDGRVPFDVIREVLQQETSLAGFNTASQHADAQPKKAPYGFCPICGARGIWRERRLNGNDRCETGCTYRSSSAINAATSAMPIFDRMLETVKGLKRDDRQQAKSMTANERTLARLKMESAFNGALVPVDPSDPLLFGIPIFEDATVADDKVLVVFADGSVETIDIGPGPKVALWQQQCRATKFDEPNFGRSDAARGLHPSPIGIVRTLEDVTRLRPAGASAVIYQVHVDELLADIASQRPQPPAPNAGEASDWPVSDGKEIEARAVEPGDDVFINGSWQRVRSTANISGNRTLLQFNAGSHTWTNPCRSHELVLARSSARDVRPVPAPVAADADLTEHEVDQLCAVSAASRGTRVQTWNAVLAKLRTLRPAAVVAACAPTDEQIDMIMCAFLGLPEKSHPTWDRANMRRAIARLDAIRQQPALAATPPPIHWPPQAWGVGRDAANDVGVVQAIDALQQTIVTGVEAIVAEMHRAAAAARTVGK